MVTQAGIDVPGSSYNDEMSSLQGLTLMPGYETSGTTVTPSSTMQPRNVPSIPSIFAVFIVLFLVWHFLSEHEKSELKPQHMRVGVHNWLLTGVFAMTFIVFFKVVMNKLTSQSKFVTGLRTFANAA